jgi:nitroreductase
VTVPPDDSLHPLLSTRWSPTVFDPAAEITDPETESLLEAARWAPSAGNSQPWAFIVGVRGDPEHLRLASHLTRSSAAWAPSAGLLVANLVHRYVEDTDWDYSEFSLYDLGQAVAHMTMQARALGLHVRQFRAFDRAGIAADFEVPPHWEVCTMSAIGRVPVDAWVSTKADPGERRPAGDRRPLEQLRWPEAASTVR